MRAQVCVTDQSSQFTSHDLSQKCILTIFKSESYNSPIYLAIFRKKDIHLIGISVFGILDVHIIKKYELT